MDTIESSLKSLFFEVIVDRAIKKMISLLPFLGWPVVSQIFSHFVYKFAKIVFEEIVLLDKFNKIDLEINEQNEQYKKAKDNLINKISENKSEAEINEAKKFYKSHLSTLISLNT